MTTASSRNAAEAAFDLLRRIREWDHLPLTGDGPYWMREIDKVLARRPTETPCVCGEVPSSECECGPTHKMRARRSTETPGGAA